jgi:hypothetical protein
MAKITKPDAVSEVPQTTPVVEPVQCSHAEDPAKCATCAKTCECGHRLGDHLYTRQRGDKGPCGDCSCDGFQETK